ncbi:MAG: hypothetical protein Kow0069_15790 [Promethearchaeota archaeon]
MNRRKVTLGSHLTSAHCVSFPFPGLRTDRGKRAAWYLGIRAAEAPESTRLAPVLSGLDSDVPPARLTFEVDSSGKRTFRVVAFHVAEALADLDLRFERLERRAGKALLLPPERTVEALLSMLGARPGDSFRFASRRRALERRFTGQDGNERALRVKWFFHAGGPGDLASTAMKLGAVLAHAGVDSTLVLASNRVPGGNAREFLAFVLRGTPDGGFERTQRLLSETPFVSREFREATLGRGDLGRFVVRDLEGPGRAVLADRSGVDLVRRCVSPVRRRGTATSARAAKAPRGPATNGWPYTSVPLKRECEGVLARAGLAWKPLLETLLLVPGLGEVVATMEAFNPRKLVLSARLARERLPEGIARVSVVVRDEESLSMASEKSRRALAASPRDIAVKFETLEEWERRVVGAGGTRSSKRLHSEASCT